MANKKGALPNPIAQALMSILGSDNLKQATIDIADAVLDQDIASGLIRDIPAVGIIAKILKARQDISNRMFANKLWYFLTRLEDIPDDKRETFRHKMDADEKVKTRVGENLLLLIDRLDEAEKADMLGQAFKAFVEESIDLPTFQKLALAINRLRVGDLSTLETFYNLSILERKNTDTEIMQGLALAHLVSFTSGDAVYGGTAAFKVNLLGETFLKTIDWQSSLV